MVVQFELIPVRRLCFRYGERLHPAPCIQIVRIGFVWRIGLCLMRVSKHDYLHVFLVLFLLSCFKVRVHPYNAQLRIRFLLKHHRNREGLPFLLRDGTELIVQFCPKIFVLVIEISEV